MIDELQAIKDAVSPTDENTGEGMDHAGARTLADTYVAAHLDEFVKFADSSVVELVAMVDNLRNLGWEHELWLAETWLLHKFEPQNIGGETAPQLRLHDAATNKK